MKPSATTPRPKILLIYTGGTIGMIENPETGALEAFDFAYLVDNVPELKKLGYDIRCIQFDPPVDSAAICTDIWTRLAESIAEEYETHDGFVILHGTDTMAYSASALSFLLEGLTKPVILTGSQLPIGALRTDGKENLITAIEIAAARRSDGSAYVPEVCIFFGNYLMRGNRTSKVSSDQFNAFDSYNYPRLAFAGINIRYKTAFITPPPDSIKTPFRIHREMDRHIAVLTLFPGITPEVIKSILGMSTVRAIVLETYGSGNAPMDPWFLSALSETVARGVVIVNVTQCVMGYVDMTRYETGHKLAQAGVISGFDITTECAIVKLMYLFGLGCSPGEVVQEMQKSLRGEISTHPDCAATQSHQMMICTGA